MVGGKAGDPRANATARVEQRSDETSHIGGFNAHGIFDRSENAK